MNDRKSVAYQWLPSDTKTTLRWAAGGCVLAGLTWLAANWLPRLETAGGTGAVLAPILLVLGRAVYQYVHDHTQQQTP